MWRFRIPPGDCVEEFIGNREGKFDQRITEVCHCLNFLLYYTSCADHSLNFFIVWNKYIGYKHKMRKGTESCHLKCDTCNKFTRVFKTFLFMSLYIRMESHFSSRQMNFTKKGLRKVKKSQRKVGKKVRVELCYLDQHGSTQIRWTLPKSPLPFTSFFIRSHLSFHTEKFQLWAAWRLSTNFSSLITNLVSIFGTLCSLTVWPYFDQTWDYVFLHIFDLLESTMLSWKPPYFPVA